MARRCFSAVSTAETPGCERVARPRILPPEGAKTQVRIRTQNQTARCKRAFLTPGAPRPQVTSGFFHPPPGQKIARDSFAILFKVDRDDLDRRGMGPGGHSNRTVAMLSVA